MNNNFLNFIEEDIETKTSVIKSLPTKTKPQIRKYNEKVEFALANYTAYEDNLRKYLTAKRDSFDVGKPEVKEVVDNADITSLERVRFLLNPSNTFVEKLELDTLLYQLNNYSDFNFNELNDIINKFVDKFQAIGVTLSPADFIYTNYVYDYMSSFLDVRLRGGNSYTHVAKKFEEIYWANPEFIEHIELNFRQLIKKHEKKFMAYLMGLQNEVAIKYGISSFEMCIAKLRELYDAKPIVTEEDIKDIVSKARNNEFDIAQYKEDSRYKETTLGNLMSNVNQNDPESLNVFYSNIMKLKENILEYQNYCHFLPLVEHFKKEYEKLLKEPYDPKNNVLRVIDGDIANEEDKLDKISKRILGPKGFFSKSPSPEEINRCKFDSVQIANELRKMYKAHDYETFKARILAVLSPNMTVQEVFNLYYSFDLQKRKDIKTSFNYSTYKEVEEKCLEFDEFVSNPNHMIVTGASVFGDNEIAKIIVNKYRLNNINIMESDLNPDNLNVILEKIDLILRLKVIKESNITPEKIHFMTKVDELLKTS